VKVRFHCLPPGFPWWCPNIFTVANRDLPPLRTGRAQLTHPAPHQPHAQHVRCWPTGGSLVRPALCPANARFDPRIGVAAFPPPELPGFDGTMQRSDFPAAICLPRLFDLSGILVLANKSRWDLTGCLADIMCNANGPSTPGLRQSLAMTRLPVLPSSMHKPWAGSESYKISGLDTVHGWTASPVHSSSLPFCVRFNAAVARRAATLDTGPVASSYPRGIPTRLSTNHFQSARASFCSWAAVVCGGCGAGRPSPSQRIVILPRRRGGGKHFFASRVPESAPG